VKALTCTGDGSQRRRIGVVGILRNEDPLKDFLFANPHVTTWMSTDHLNAPAAHKATRCQAYDGHTSPAVQSQLPVKDTSYNALRQTVGGTEKPFTS
jgi:hypothetical protein